MPDYEQGISFILTALNEGSHIEETLTDIHAALSEQSFRFEMICIDDGSKDETFEGMRRFAEGRPEVVIHRFEENVGLGRAARWGMGRVRYDYMMWLPTNAMLDPRSIFHMLEDRTEDRLLMFIADNMHIRPPERRIISKAYHTIMTQYFGIGTAYVHGLLLLPSRKVVLDDVQAERSFYVLEVLVLALRKWGLKPEQRWIRIQRATGVERTKSFSLRNIAEIAASVRDLKRRIG